jgi:hypothetical protein
VPRTFEMMTADISDLRGTVTALTDELSSLKRNGYAGAAQDGSSGGNSRGGKSGILNAAGKSAPVVLTDVASVSRAINHLNAQIQVSYILQSNALSHMYCVHVGYIEQFTCC